MPSPTTLTGGARLGIVNWSWPFAKLTATPSGLRLKVTFKRAYQIPMNSIVRIYPCGVIPVIGTGVRVEHTVEQYPARVIFWYPMRPHSDVFSYLLAAGVPPEKLAT